jgi:nitrate/nitrite transporter NarK
VGLLDRKTMIVAVPFISSIANIAGFITPAIIGYVRDVTGSYMSGFIMAACIQGAGVLLVLFGVQFIVAKRRGLRDERGPDRAANAL